jgi:phage-related protein
MEQDRPIATRFKLVSSPPGQANYRILPLPRVQREAKKLLTLQQLAEGIAVATQLRHYPNVPFLSIEPCGQGMELRLESKSLNQQGWLRAIFFIDDENKVIYIVDLFWKKTNKVSLADLHRINHRIRQLKLLLSAGGHPWKSGE